MAGYTLQQLQQMGAKKQGFTLDELKAKSSLMQLATKPVTTKDVVKGLPQAALDTGKGIFDFLTGSEQAFGKDIGQSIAYLSGTGKKIEQVNQQEFQTGDTALHQAMFYKDDPVKAKKYLNMAKSAYEAGGANWNDILPFVQKTAEQVLGEAAGVFLDIASAGTYSKAGLVGEKALTTGLQKATPTAISAIEKGAQKGVGFLQGAKEGAKAGVKVGTPLGAAYGVTGAMEENQSLGNVAISGLKGGAFGAATGGLLGLVTGGISGRQKYNKIKTQETALNNIIPQPKEMSQKEYRSALIQQRVSPKTATGGAKIIPTETEIGYAKKYSDLLQSKDPVTNISNVVDRISENDASIGAYLQEHDVIFNDGELRNKIIDKMKNVGVLDVMDQKALDKAKSGVIDDLMNRIESNKLSDLFRGRQSFDIYIKNYLNAFGGSPSFKKDMSKAVRDAANEFITEHLGEDTYKATMYDSSSLFKVVDLLETKAIKERGMSAIKLWIKKNPIKAKIIEGAIGAGGVGAGIKLFTD